MWTTVLLILGLQPTTPVITVDRDNVEITQSCTIQIAADSIADTDGNGVIHISTDGVTVDFTNQRLHGAHAQQLPDSFTGIGVNITGKNVTLRNANISGYKVGIHAKGANGLTIHHVDVSNNFHQRLKSTVQAEDASDWLWPHANDNNEWMTNYGAGICVEDSKTVTLHDVKARKTQNGIIFDRVDDSKVYDCDCSFLSGWGLAMWRSSRNVISRNAFDFCIRGYSHGVYNRGQDSAGILMFEQCNENVIIENSATHCGDGVFGFAGKEALGEVTIHDDPLWYRTRGCSQNHFISNDLSYAAAHGLEMTFSFHNLIESNSFRNNAICGIWAGYSQVFMIRGNTFVENGDAGYGAERGGINIDSGRTNHVSGNSFRSNRCGVRLWYGASEAFSKLPWAKANLATGHVGGIIDDNKFVGDQIGLELRDTVLIDMRGNSFEAVGREIDAAESVKVRTGPRPDSLPNGGVEYWATVFPATGAVIGQQRPVGGRPLLPGREHIIMTEWGPWDHESPLLRFERWFDHANEYRLLGTDRLPNENDIQVQGDVLVDVNDRLIRVSAKKDNTIVPYAFSFHADGEVVRESGVLIGGFWEVWTFPSACDPREDAERWRKAGIAEHHTLTANTLDFRFANAGMSESRGLPVKLPSNHFGVIATRSLTIPPGKWNLKSTSDDGIRVWMNGNLVIDDWTWHGPTQHDHVFEVVEQREVAFRVEYFELDGYAVLSLDIEKSD